MIFSRNHHSSMTIRPASGGRRATERQSFIYSQSACVLKCVKEVHRRVCHCSESVWDVSDLNWMRVHAKTKWPFLTISAELIASPLWMLSLLRSNSETPEVLHFVIPPIIGSDRPGANAAARGLPNNWVMAIILWWKSLMKFSRHEEWWLRSRIEHPSYSIFTVPIVLVRLRLYRCVPSLLEEYLLPAHAQNNYFESRCVGILLYWLHRAGGN